MGELLKRLAELPVQTLSTPEPDLEEIFLGLYEGDDAGEGPSGEDDDAA